MDLTALRAAEAYAQAARTAVEPAASAAAETPRADFGALAAEAAGEVEAAVRAGEAAGQAVARGEGDLVDVVTAVSAAEVSLQAAVAVRNRVIEAYQEILRMPI